MPKRKARSRVTRSGPGSQKARTTRVNRAKKKVSDLVRSGKVKDISRLSSASLNQIIKDEKVNTKLAKQAATLLAKRGGK